MHVLLYSTILYTVRSGQEICYWYPVIQYNLFQVTRYSVQDGHDVTNSTGRRLEELKEIALNRNVWKRVVHNVTRGRQRPDGR